MKALDFAICSVSWCKIYHHRFECMTYLYLRLVAEKQWKYIQLIFQEAICGGNFIICCMFCFNFVNITQTASRHILKTV